MNESEHLMIFTSPTYSLPLSLPSFSAIKTAWLTLLSSQLTHLPSTAAWELNERMWGLAGLTPEEAYSKYTVERVKQWSKSLSLAPPPVEPGSDVDPRREERYQEGGREGGREGGKEGGWPPRTESFVDTQCRAVDYWRRVIQPYMEERRRREGEREGGGVTVLVVSHANTIRSLMGHLDDVRVGACEGGIGREGGGDEETVAFFRG